MTIGRSPASQYRRTSRSMGIWAFGDGGPGIAAFGLREGAKGKEKGTEMLILENTYGL
jgi:hypothetical protein